MIFDVEPIGADHSLKKRSTDKIIISTIDNIAIESSTKIIKELKTQKFMSQKLMLLVLQLILDIIWL